MQAVTIVTYSSFGYQPVAEGEFLHRGDQGGIGRSHGVKQWHKVADINGNHETRKDGKALKN